MFSMACTENLLKRLGGLRLGAFEDAKGMVTLQVVVFNAAGAKEKGD
jgi:hypothetical protein